MVESLSTPLHIAIIMDGNGRWAAQRGRARTDGHSEGLKTARRIVEAASKRGIKYLTLYVFSTENWKRAAGEVDFIMSLVKAHLLRELDFYKAHGLRIRHAGDIDGLPADIAGELRKAIDVTADFTGMQVVLALNYGGRGEIVRAVRRLAEREGGTAIGGISEEALRGALDNPDIPDPDLIIRTGGEERTSNFLLWEGAYSEYYFSEKLWPDWGEADLEEALCAFSKRTRRFGGLKLE
jgi:undecaprenyl diphosphate synthase